MNIPIWFLDIDGVLNAFGDEAPAHLTRTDAETSGTVWPIRYSPDVVTFINTCHRGGDVEVRWLTTWEQDAHLSFAPAVGLDAFPSYDIPDTNSLLGWWKSDLVAASIQTEQRPFIWTDDDLATEDLTFMADTAVPHLRLAPDESLGLTSADLRQVAEFIGQHS